MNNKDLPLMVAIAKTVSGSSGGGLPDPILPSSPNSRSTLNSIVSAGNNKTYRSLLTYYQIQVNGQNDGTYNVSVGNRTSSTSDLISFFKMSSSSLEPMVGMITMTLYNYKPDGSYPTESYTQRLKMSGYKALSNGIEIYFPYTSYKDNTLYKGVFVVTVTAEGYTCEYVLEA